ncbi:unnamed protein product [Mytilus coruscus]|uniref:RRBP1 n=1 Tax=Mytilus coruscus TaxID=42192 RepID=A0A6J7ZXF5_MYTCO|nr:unnamed protein product [Mytilus coruscus]
MLKFGIPKGNRVIPTAVSVNLTKIKNAKTLFTDKVDYKRGVVNLVKSIPSGCLEIFRMDPQVIMIGFVAFVVSAMLIYLISAFGFKEKSYEEAVAEQKKRLEAEQDKVRKEKKAEKEIKVCR